MAITAHVLGEWLRAAEGVLRPPKPDLFLRPPPSTLAARQLRGSKDTPDALSDALALVRDVVSRRDGTRHVDPEPLTAFPQVLPVLHYGEHETWWRQMFAELAALNRDLTPTAHRPVRRAARRGAHFRRSIGAGRRRLRAMNQIDELPTLFTGGELVVFEHLQKRGGSRAVFSQQDAERALRLNTLRQRIHPGSYVNASPSEMDLRPEEAREARETLDHSLRIILRWVEAMPNPEGP